MTRAYSPFIDWMKCLGMAMIVFWHVSTYAAHLIPPIYPKQLGVAFFLFATGYSLALERRPRGEVLFNRLFEVYLFGVGFALLASAVNFARVGDVNESNYLPFLLGANVAFNNFPANPTTWYIGTYLHIILVWALVLRRVRVRPWMLAATCVVEVLLRAALAETRGLFVAYMALSNWATVFLLGLYCGQRDEEAPGSGPARWIGGLALLVVAWRLVAGPWVARDSFPFMDLSVGPRAIDVVVRSSAVSFVYVAYTWMTYQVTRRLPASAVARFFARNTLIIFIAHMPVFYALEGTLAPRTVNVAVRVVVRFTVCFLGLAALSEMILRTVRPKHLRDELWWRIRRTATSSGTSRWDPVPSEGPTLSVASMERPAHGQRRGDDRPG